MTRRNDNYNNDGSSTYLNDFYHTFDLVRVFVDDSLVYSMGDDAIRQQQQQQYPITMSVFCPSYALFSPLWIVRAPESYPSLCGSIPYDTLIEFRTMFQYDTTTYYILQRPIAIFVNATRDDMCSINVIMRNVELINAIPIGSNNITHLILPESYRPMNHSSNYNNNQYTTDSWNDMDTCVYSNIISLFIPDNVTGQLISDMIEWKQQQKEHQNDGYYRWSKTSPDEYSMMIAYDVNYDGIITWDDYDAYYYYPDTTSYGSSSSLYGGISTTAKMWIITFIVVSVIIYCVTHYRIRRQVRQQQQQRTQSNGVITTTTTTTSGTNNGTSTTTGQDRSNDNKKPVLISEADFATLPQIMYRFSNNQNQSSKSLVVPQTTITTTTKDDDMILPEIPILLTTCAITAESNDNFTYPSKMLNGTSVTITQNTQQQEQQEQQQKEQLYVECSKYDVTNKDNNNNNFERKSQHSISYQEEFVKNNSQRSFGVSSRTVDCCSICLEEFQDKEILTALPRCLHLFHTKCIKEWLMVQKKDTCPLCKTTILVDGSENTNEC